MTMIPEKLFRTNNHSKFKIDWCGVNPEQADEATQAFSLWRLGKPIEILLVDEWQQVSNNFRISLSNGSRFLLRKNVRDNQEEKIVLLDRITSFLRSKGIPIPLTIHSPGEKPFVIFDGHIFQLFEFVEGDHYRGTQKELERVARHIAQLHKALADICFPIEELRKTPWTVERLTQWCDRAISDQSSHGIILRSNSDFILDQACFVSESLKLGGDLRVQIIHRDLHPQNMLFKDDSLVAILDYSDVSYGRLAADVGNACHRFVRQFVVYQREMNQRLPIYELLVEGVELFFREYLKSNSLNSFDLVSVPFLIKDELLRKLNSCLTKWYEHQNEMAVRGELEKFISLLKEADYIGMVLDGWLHTGVK